MSSPKNCVMIINDNIDLVNLFKIALEHERIETQAFTDSTLACRNLNQTQISFRSSSLIMQLN